MGKSKVEMLLEDLEKETRLMQQRQQEQAAHEAWMQSGLKTFEESGFTITQQQHSAAVEHTIDFGEDSRGDCHILTVWGIGQITKNAEIAKLHLSPNRGGMLIYSEPSDGERLLATVRLAKNPDELNHQELSTKIYLDSTDDYRAFARFVSGLGADDSKVIKALRAIYKLWLHQNRFTNETGALRSLLLNIDGTENEFHARKCLLEFAAKLKNLSDKLSHEIQDNPTLADSHKWVHKYLTMVSDTPLESLNIEAAKLVAERLRKVMSS
jgi:hypothetical protein